MYKFKKIKETGRKINICLLAGLLSVGFTPLGRYSSMKALAATGVPGGTPDYWTTPNYANSQLPEFDSTTGEHIAGTGIRKFVDTLPGVGEANKNNLGQYLPVAVPDTTTYPGSDYYEISLVEYEEQMHSDLQPTKLRGYMQTNTTDPNVSKPNYLGPIIVAKKDRPVRIKFTNKLPTGSGGDLFLPLDESLMGAGLGPDGVNKYTQNRATLHLHGGVTPWISDGTPHQWITPAGENTPYPKGVSVRNVPDMPDPGDGSQTFFYSNQQSARLMFFHDHSLGLTRLNVYAGEAAGYLIRDQVEQDLIDQGVIPSGNSEIPLIIEDKTFVPSDTQLKATDPTWDTNKWGGQGSLWFPHVYMPNQNPYDLSGSNPMGRWDYGPWFWPPNTGLKNGPVANQLAGDEGQAPMNPGTPNISTTPEAFMDTPVINGTAYPTLTVDPKAYRFRILNASNDRMWNLQFYQAKSNGEMWKADGTLNDADAGEVKMVDAVRKTGYPSTWPTDGREGGVPDPATAGPEMIQIGNESGFLPKPAVLKNQPINYEYGRRSITVLNVSDKTLLLAPAERADVVVDFSKYAGQTLILYNDAPAPVPAFDPRYDYYTGDPDQSATGENTGGAPTTQPGFGPNTRTIMQIKVAADPNAVDTIQSTLNKLNAAVPNAFATGQKELIFPNQPDDPNRKWVNIQDTSTTFTPPGATTSVTMDLKPKAIAEEFEQNYGRMDATLGVEMPNTNFQNQTTIMLGYVDPSTENLQDSMTPIGSPSGDGTQLWKITHNGVDTHAIHFHLFDVQLINRVGWDGSIRFPDANELGWKDTVRMNPLEDCIVALRPISPKLPFGLPDSIRPLDPTMPLGSTGQFMNIDPQTGNPVTVTNQMTNFAWEYVWHCHLLGHEENDMMRTISFNFINTKPSPSTLSLTRTNGGQVDLTWTDPTKVTVNNDTYDLTTLGKSSNEIGFNIMRAPVINGTVGEFTKIGSVLANNTQYTDTTVDLNTTYSYRVDAFNAATAADKLDPNSYLTGGTPSNTVNAPGIPLAPSNLKATPSGVNVNLTWTNNATNATGFVVERSTDGKNFSYVGSSTQSKFTDTGLIVGTTYTYRVKAINGTLSSQYSNTSSVTIAAVAPAAPSNLTASVQSGPSVRLSWTDQSLNETGFTIERSNDGVNFTVIGTRGVNSGSGTTVTYSDTTVQAGKKYYYRVNAVNGNTPSSYSNTVNVTISNVPTAPTGISATATSGTTTDTIRVSWTAPAGTINSYDVQFSTDSSFATNVSTYNTGSNWTTYSRTGFLKKKTYYVRVRAVNQIGNSTWSNSISILTP
ncbi:fibronectin type III domain-containing protein [Neobacillus cucumis]|uniref:fibronectin type III domain-containing protein n=1 Tax=Neobacillus cucumis TaxID=1740721 RepID=UPI0028530D7D|nr:fibronectin type III domain-containing protein [Neobacillus cucumis]MDR4948298.1 fibronectin type III domain-containing protein [Neobacillus cucumis]